MATEELNLGLRRILEYTTTIRVVNYSSLLLVQYSNLPVPGYLFHFRSLTIGCHLGLLRNAL